MNLKFNEAYDKYLEYLSIRLKPTTILLIKRKFKNHILPIFQNKNIYEITDDDYLKWQNYVKNLGFGKSFNNQMYSIIKAYFDYLNKFYCITNFPIKYGKIITFKPGKIHELNVWNMREYKKFIKKVNDPIYHALFNLLFFTGMRKGEALALKFTHFKGKYIYVKDTITKEYFDGKRLIMEPKTKNSERKIQIDFKLRREIKKLHKYYAKNFINFNDEFFIFGGTTPLATTTLERKKNNYCKIANVKQIRIHDFRHSHATLLYHKKVKIKYIQARLGHADISTTLNTYVHFDEKYEKRVQRTLNFLRLR